MYIFKRSGTSWTQQQRIQSSDIASNDNFGSAVAMDGDYLAVSSPYDNSNVGAVYFFKKDDGAETSTQQTKIIPSGATTQDYIGQIGSLSISGDTVVVGAVIMIQVVHLMRVRRGYLNDRERHGPRLRNFLRVIKVLGTDLV